MITDMITEKSLVARVRRYARIIGHEFHKARKEFWEAGILVQYYTVDETGTMRGLYPDLESAYRDIQDQACERLK